MGGPDGRAKHRGSHPDAHGFPADLYLEGSDQHRGWFHSSLLVSCMLNGVPPYKALLTHGFAVDGEGKKMSKSKGNVVAPQKVSDTLGADILRLWVAATDYSGDLTISDEILKRNVESYRRIRNTLRFLIANTSDFTAKDAPRHDELFEIDRYALARVAKLIGEVAADYDRYEFHLVVQKVTTYCSEDLGGFYLDALKDRLYTTAPTSRARRSAQAALAAIRDALLLLLAPGAFVHERGGLARRASRRHDDLHAHVEGRGAYGPRRRCADREMGRDPVGACRGAQGDRVGAPVRPHRQLAAGRGDDLGARARLRRAGVARRRPALRDDHVGRARRARRRARDRGQSVGRRESASAAGTGAATSEAIRSTRRCAVAASPTCSAPANPGRTPEVQAR
jgi:hypothetical protein